MRSFDQVGLSWQCSYSQGYDLLIGGCAQKTCYGRPLPLLCTTECGVGSFCGALVRNTMDLLTCGEMQADGVLSSYIAFISFISGIYFLRAIGGVCIR